LDCGLTPGFQTFVQDAIREHALWLDAVIYCLLGRWVSEYTPVLVMQDHWPVGLTALEYDRQYLRPVVVVRVSDVPKAEIGEAYFQRAWKTECDSRSHRSP